MKTATLEALHVRAGELIANPQGMVCLLQRDYTEDTAAAIRKLDEARALLLRWTSVNRDLMGFAIDLENVRNPLNRNLQEF